MEEKFPLFDQSIGGHVVGPSRLVPIGKKRRVVCRVCFMEFSTVYLSSPSQEPVPARFFVLWGRKCFYQEKWEPR